MSATAHIKQISSSNRKDYGSNPGSSADLGYKDIEILRLNKYFFLFFCLAMNLPYAFYCTAVTHPNLFLSTDSKPITCSHTKLGPITQKLHFRSFTQTKQKKKAQRLSATANGGVNWFTKISKPLRPKFMIKNTILDNPTLSFVLQSFAI